MLLNTLSASSYGFFFKQNNGYLYQDLGIFSLENPAQPALIGQLSPPQSWLNAQPQMIVENGYVFLPAHNNLFIYRFIPATPISNLSHPTYLVDKLRAEGQVFSDRIDHWKEPIPQPLRNQPMIMTRNDDKNSTATLLGFDISQPGDMYIGFDERRSPRPAWLWDWQATGQRLMSEDVPVGRVLYRKHFSVGHVTLGPNRDPEMPALDDVSNMSITFVPNSSAGSWNLYL